jgi:succinate-semialdehyde dehydrogenase/glutarate-semialdehyde dehydrogenase
MRRRYLQRGGSPAGGAKQSGVGREGGLEGSKEYLYTQYIGIADPYAG